MVVLLSPGQGSQQPGMLDPWLTLPGAGERVARWSDIAGLDLVAAGTTWDAERIRDTAVAQPLLTALALLSAQELLGSSVPAAVCGHSIGELPALAIAGVLTADEAVGLAAVRGRLMALATEQAQTGMVAVLGGDADEVLDAAQVHGLDVATVNVAGQVVLGGPADALTAFAAAAPTGARVRPLDVAGAFHTRAMASAREGFAVALTDLTPHHARSVVVANADGASITDGAESLDRLLAQLTSPVRFDLCLQAIAALQPAVVIELAPGGTLTSLAKRALPGVELIALRTPDDLPAARAALAHSGEQTHLPWQALPSPDSGVVDQLRDVGDAVVSGDPVAVVAGRSGASTVVAPLTGAVTEWLVSPGDPVRVGQLLAVVT